MRVDCSGNYKTVLSYLWFDNSNEEYCKCTYTYRFKHYSHSYLQVQVNTMYLGSLSFSKCSLVS